MDDEQKEAIKQKVEGNLTMAVIEAYDRTLRHSFSGELFDPNKVIEIIKKRSKFLNDEIAEILENSDGVGSE